MVGVRRPEDFCEEERDLEREARPRGVFGFGDLDGERLTEDFLGVFFGVARDLETERDLPLFGPGDLALRDGVFDFFLGVV